MDLRDHPERVDAIPEVAKSRAMGDLLRLIAEPLSPTMSIACECSAFESPQIPEGKLRWEAGGFIVISYKDAELNTDPERFIGIARTLLGGIDPSNDHIVNFVMTIEPLKFFFGRDDCFSLEIKPLGYGRTQEEAWAAFEHATSAITNAIRAERAKAAGADDPLLAD
jgi:hypothetical protein